MCSVSCWFIAPMIAIVATGCIATLVYKLTTLGLVICIGLNYSDHAAESGMDIPEEPIIFFKAPNTVVGPNDVSRRTAEQ